MGRRIAIEAQRVLRPKRHGMDVVALQLIRHLLERDRDNTYFVYLDRPDTDNELGEWPNLVKRVLRMPTYPLWEQVALPLALRRDSIELAHFTSSTGPLLWDGPTVVTLHDVMFMQASLSLQGTWYQRLGALYRRLVVPAVARRADQVLTVSEFERGRILELLPMEAEKLSVVHNGVGHPFLGGTNHRNSRPGTPVPERYLLFLGNEAPKKNTLRVLEAYAMLVKAQPDAPDLVVLELSHPRVEQLLSSIGEGSLAARVHCPGYVDHDGLRALYAGAEAFLYPSLAESFGLPVLEAMACGTPVLTSNVTSMPEVAGNAAFLVNPFDIEDLARGLQTLCASPTLRNTLRHKGLARASRFSWHQVAEQTADVHAAVLDRARVPTLTEAA